VGHRPSLGGYSGISNIIKKSCPGGGGNTAPWSPLPTPMLRTYSFIRFRFSFICQGT